MTVTLAHWTIADYHHMIQVGLLADRSVELLNGAVVEMSPESPDHAQGCTDTADYLRSKLGDLALIRETKPITLPLQNSEPQPDIAVVLPQRSLYRTQRHPYPEEIFLLIEYANTSWKKDTGIKRQLYAQAGIPDYWVIHLAARQVRIYRDPQGEDYRSMTTLSQGPIRLLAFPDVELAIEPFLTGI
ncbi:Uma2 family endonuclease [Alkalinema sp. FACHB-956]|uniref:Uma2 family endonuclease n=1 Tax=Alkalinema sp. FACHB-956 TaxID=2692768 RepID=UPI0016866081|nr:Uma2 family endonuclease [Alkalinema sp. FACHB-956]MBD2327504.1 Uma2 family endonuclease [Alkalinema sp. FACHB-956]